MALAGGPVERRADGRQHGRLQARQRGAAVGGQPDPGVHRRRRPDGRRQPRHGPGRHGRPGAPGPPRHRRHRLHRLVRRRDEAVPLVLEGRGRARASSRWAARTRPSSSRNADLDEAAEGIMRSAFGFGGQKCSANSRVYVERAGARRARPDARREDRGDHDRRPDRARELARPDHRPEGGRPAPAGGRRGAPGRARSSSAASTSPTATWRAGSTSSRRSSAGCRPTTGCSATSCSRRSPRSRRSTRSTRR